MTRHHMLLAALLFLPLAGCGGAKEEEEAMSGLQASFGKMGQCITVHAAMIATGMNPMTVAMNGEGTADLFTGMHELTGNLPTDSTGQTSPREAFTRVIAQLEGIRGRGLEAAGQLAESAAYQADAGVLAGWYSAHCAKEDEAKPAD